MYKAADEGGSPDDDMRRMPGPLFPGSFRTDWLRGSPVKSSTSPVKFPVKLSAETPIVEQNNNE